ncbi:MAG: hypothetical protein WC389_04955 [Lutibacter sp.]|jgi:cytochrome c oxidase assembly protein Cox11
MVVLKKIKASTLVETITASVIIIIVFAIASLTLNNVFASTINNDTHQIENHLYKLEYQYENHKISIPYNEAYENWELSIAKVEENDTNWIVFKAVNTITKKAVVKRRKYVEV